MNKKEYMAPVMEETELEMEALMFEVSVTEEEEVTGDEAESRLLDLWVFDDDIEGQ